MPNLCSLSVPFIEDRVGFGMSASMKSFKEAESRIGIHIYIYMYIYTDNKWLSDDHFWLASRRMQTPHEVAFAAWMS